MTGVDEKFEIFLAAPPGLEEVLAGEVSRKGFRQPKVVPGGVVTQGGWPEVWRANLWLRGASRVLARVAQFRAVHVAQLHDRAREVAWGALLRRDVAFRVEASCAQSKLWHSGAVAQRVAMAIRERVGAEEAEDAPITVRARMEKDLCTLSLDTSGELLHRRGFKQAVNPAPLRETMAALFLMQCGYEGNEPLLDPMCGAGTFVIEAAEMVARLNPGRARSFAFENLKNFDAEAWGRMRAVTRAPAEGVVCRGLDRDAGAVAMSLANAERAGVAAGTVFAQGVVSDLQRPEGPPGLVIVNPPYGSRIGDRKALAPLYRALGQVLRSRFQGWRVGLVAAEPALARETRLPFLPPGPPVPHGGLRVTLFRTGPLP
ncbi:class I SAM-dependent RNA methyltransferase [Roseomonas stagni]|uniref:Class I SAM-dependent RNA methyltransferase n=1 Tax=Falsiroseomonas algicola TaxID=2716930 RepID=A0A6M1LWM0_9PROT|nr:class I SAM-dependent RNA methyltransferase [Falsiroseomonas algicola]NGM23874.1 class I SAM-dependent RNA methyltransferase [Falsiroseomonas algicola]